MHGPLDRGVNWMSPLQGRSPGRSPLVQVKEPYGNLDMVNNLKAFILQPGVYKVHLLIILAGEGLAVNIEKERKKGKISKRKFKLSSRTYLVLL